MFDIEKIALLQRIIGSIKSDIESKNYDKVSGKMDILEGEVGIIRKIIEDTNTDNSEIASEPVENANFESEVVDTTGEIIN